MLKTQDAFYIARYDIKKYGEIISSEGALRRAWAVQVGPIYQHTFCLDVAYRFGCVVHPRHPRSGFRPFRN